MTGVVVWVTGLPSAGKSKLARAVRERLQFLGTTAVLLDGDEVRQALVPAPDYSETGREAFYATLGGLAALLSKQGHVVLVAATAHRRHYRDQARAMAERFIEVFVDTSIEVARSRDSKGLYRAAQAGQMQRVPGVDEPYEPPEHPDVVAHGGRDAEAVERVIQTLLGPAVTSGGA